MVSRGSGVGVESTTTPLYSKFRQKSQKQKLIESEIRQIKNLKLKMHARMVLMIL